MHQGAGSGSDRTGNTVAVEVSRTACPPASAWRLPVERRERVVQATHKQNTGVMPVFLGSLKALVPHFLLDQLFQPLDRLLLQRLGVHPELPQLIPPFGVGDVLIVSPEAVEPTAQLVNQIVVVVGTA